MLQLVFILLYLVIDKKSRVSRHPFREEKLIFSNLFCPTVFEQFPIKQKIPLWKSIAGIISVIILDRLAVHFRFQVGLHYRTEVIHLKQNGHQLIPIIQAV